MKKLIKDNLFDYLLCVLVLILPFSKAIPNITLVLLSLLYIKDFSYHSFKAIKLFPNIIIFCFFAYLLLKAVILGTFLDDFKIYKGYLLTLWLLIVLQKIKDLNLLKFFVLISINLMVFVSFGLIGNYYLHHHALPFSNTSEVNTLLVLERPYAGFMAVMGVFLSFEFLETMPKQKIFFIINSIIMIFFVLIISARLSIISIFIVVIIYLLFFYKINVYKKIGTVFLLIVFLGSALFFNKNIANRFFIKDNMAKSLATASDYEPRIVIWSCAKEMVKKDDFNFFLGFNTYKKISNNYSECYGSSIKNVSKRDYFSVMQFNSHNQFIDIFLIGGLLGLLLLLFWFFSTFYFVKNNFFKISILVSTAFFFTVENVLYRQFGCYIFCIFAAMLITKKPSLNGKN